LSTTSAHHAAWDGDFKLLRLIVQDDKTAVARRDKNGWIPLHEASRNGDTRMVKFLLDNGSDVNLRTNTNMTPLYLAIANLGGVHPTTQLIKSHGGILYEPQVSHPFAL